MFEPHPVLRQVRHKVNNLLAPVQVAAEILEDGTPTTAMLVRAVEQLKEFSSGVGRILHVPPVSPSSVPLEELLTAMGCDCAELLRIDADAHVDPERLITAIRKLRELLAGGQTHCRLEDICLPPQETSSTTCLVVEFTSAGVSIADHLVADLSLPCASSIHETDLAEILRDLHLQGVRIRVAGDAWEVCLPVQGLSR